ncbi:MAG TPA: hemerythrin domain-containing protein, partial [Ilumatobacteraceae bacterium]|nr:hemerythrin domain-containing protein [Ilumatobacteraceae bacterium]
MFRGLRHHHDIEDQLVVPIVAERTDDDERHHLDVLHAQHDAIVTLVEQADAQLAVWQLDTAHANRDQLAALLERIDELLVEHLDTEERFVFPIAERLLTPAEWDEIGRRAEAGYRLRERILSFGMIQHEGEPEVLASMLATAPTLVRRLLPVFARRAYRRHSHQIHGGPSATARTRTNGWRIALALGGALMAAGGPLHPESDAKDPLREELATMTAGDTWVLSHSLIAAGTVLLALGLWSAVRSSRWPQSMMRALRVTAVAMSLYVVETIFHLAAVLDSRALADGDAAPIAFTHIGLSVLLYPVSGLAFAWLNTHLLRCRSFRDVLGGVVGVASGLLQAAAVPLTLALPDTEFTPVFASGSMLLATWSLLVGVFGLRSRGTTGSKTTTALAVASLAAVVSVTAVVTELAPSPTEAATAYPPGAGMRGYRIYDLSGGAINFELMTTTGLSDNGVVSGNWVGHDNSVHPFFWKPGVGWQNLDRGSAINAWANAISPDGSTIVGYDYDPATPAPHQHRVEWTWDDELGIYGAAQRVEPFGHETADVPLAVNDDGDVLVAGAVIDSDGGRTPLALPPYTPEQRPTYTAHAMNANGDVTGLVSYDPDGDLGPLSLQIVPAVWTAGTPTELGLPPGAAAAWGYAINDSGDVAVGFGGGNVSWLREGNGWVEMAPFAPSDI